MGFVALMSGDADPVNRLQAIKALLFDGAKHAKGLEAVEALGRRVINRNLPRMIPYPFQLPDVRKCAKWVCFF